MWFNRYSVGLLIVGLISTLSVFGFVQPVSADSTKSHDELGLLSTNDAQQLDDLNNQLSADGADCQIVLYSYRSLPKNSEWEELDDFVNGRPSVSNYIDIADGAKEEMFAHKLGVEDVSVLSDSQYRKLDKAMKQQLILFVVPVEQNHYRIIPSGSGLNGGFITDFQNWYTTLGLCSTITTGSNIVRFARRYAAFYQTHYLHKSQYPQGETPDWNMVQSFIVCTTLLWLPVMFLLWRRRQPPQNPLSPDDFHDDGGEDDFFMGYMIGSEMKDHDNG